MSYREAMSVTVSAAEWEIRKTLEQKGIRMQYQKQIILDAHKVDIYGETAQVAHCFEIDGPVHMTSEKARLRDDYVMALLEKRGFKVWHLPYVPPLSNKRLAEILAFIEEKGFHTR